MDNAQKAPVPESEAGNNHSSKTSIQESTTDSAFEGEDTQFSNLPPIEQITRLIEELPEGERLEFISSYLQYTQFSGPFPPPKMVEEYNKVMPEFGTQCMKSFIKETEHRRKIERKASNVIIRSQILAFVLTLVMVGSGVYLAIEGHDTVAGILVGTSLISVVAALLGKNIGRSKE